MKKNRTISRSRAVCPECGAWLFSHEHACARCGWGVNDGREGVSVGDGLFVHGGGAAHKPVKVFSDGYGLEEK